MFHIRVIFLFPHLTSHPLTSPSLFLETMISVVWHVCVCKLSPSQFAVVTVLLMHEPCETLVSVHFRKVGQNINEMNEEFKLCYSSEKTYIQTKVPCAMVLIQLCSCV